MLRTYRRPIRPSHPAAALIACGLMLCVASPAFAQLGQGGQTGGGQTGGGQTGGGLGGGGLGGGGTGGGAGGVSTGGPGSLGGSLAGPELMTFGADVDVTGGTGFVGRGNTSENFVGGLVQGQGTTQSPFGAGGRANSMFQGISRQGQGQFRGQFQQPTGPSRSERIRPRHRVAFEFTPRQTETITTNLQTRVTSFSGYTGNPDGVAVTVSGQGVATLSGTVGDERSSRLAAALARLEPGVRSVDNQLTVAPQTP